jgi:CheY-like chemotaxis protein
MNIQATPPTQHILVVDDETMIAMMMEDMLCDLGCAVLGPVGAVAPALELIQAKANVLNGAFLDVNLRGETIYPVAAELLERNVPFVFLSGHTRVDIDPRFLAVPLLSKPVQPLLIEHTLKRFGALIADCK